MARISPIKQQSVERTEAELEELAEQLIALKGQFHQKIINKDIALKFAKELKDMSVFINGCYSTRTPPPKRYSCGVGYQSPDENELLLGTLVKDVIMKKMHLPSNPKKEDMFHYMVHSTVVHMLRCSSDGAITLHFNPELLTEWKRIYVNNRHDPALDNPYEAVLKSVTGSSSTSVNIPSMIEEATDGGNFVSTAATMDEPKVDEVFDRLKNKSSKWYDIGRELKVEKDYRDSLNHDGSSIETKLENVLHKWKESRCSDVTWKNLKKVLKNLGYNDVLQDPIFRSIEE